VKKGNTNEYESENPSTFPAVGNPVFVKAVIVKTHPPIQV